jgi:hypothetical protein
MIWSAVFPGLIFQGVLVVVVGECRGRQGVFHFDGAHFGHGDELKFGILLYPMAYSMILQTERGHDGFMLAQGI